jgi:glycosyltransferase involved in cell wall biosynthesis
MDERLMSATLPPPVTDTVSVLLPVHHGIDGEHLDEALTSITGQSRPADEVVVVEDGPLPKPLVRLLDTLEHDTPGVVRVRLATNGGAGVANQAGLMAASGTWIAKADADDINERHRFATQLDAVRRSGVDVCGAFMGEFSKDSTDLEGIRISPRGTDEIARRLRWNNPVNHPTAFYRREVAVSVGGYPALRYMQDYDLFARMWAAGAQFLNLNEVLVLFRADPRMYARRKSLLIHRAEWELQSNLRRYGVTSPTDRVRNLVLRTGYRLLPEAVTTRTHRALFRRKPVGSVPS